VSEEQRYGGPAFQFEYHNQTGSYQDGFFGTGKLAPGASQQFAGMSLRDYFAAKAMQGLLACPDTKSGNPALYASNAYAYADAMLKERNK